MGSVLVNYNDPASEVLSKSIEHKSLDANPVSSSFRALREEHARREEEERRRREEEARFMAEQQRLQEEKEEQERTRAEHEENLRLQRQVSSASWVMANIYDRQTSSQIQIMCIVGFYMANDNNEF